MSEIIARKRKVRPWAEAAKLVLNSHEALPICDIFERIKEQGLRDTTPGSKECLFSMMRAHSRGQHSMFYRKIDQQNKQICFGLRSDLPPSTLIIETDADTDDESQKHDSRFKPKVQLLKMHVGTEASENVAPVVNSLAPVKRKTVSPTEEPPPKRCLRPKPQRVSDERSSTADNDNSVYSAHSSTPTRTSSPTNSSSCDEMPFAPPTARFQTMREMLSSLSDSIGIRINKRPPKKCTLSQQLEETKRGCIDMETPESILVSVHIKELLSSYTFALLPKHYQYKLASMFPDVDRPCREDDDVSVDTALNNEFFASACQEWRERLMDGDLTPESQLKQKAEYERHLKAIDSWKMRNFEEVWGAKAVPQVEQMQYEVLKALDERARAEAEQKQVKVEVVRLEDQENMVNKGNDKVPTPIAVMKPPVKKETEEEISERETHKFSILLPHATSTLHQVLADHGVPVSSNHRRKCNNLIPPSLCLSAKRLSLNLHPPPRCFVNAPVTIARRRRGYYRTQIAQKPLEDVLRRETQHRADREMKALGDHLSKVDRFLENPPFMPLPVPLDVFELMNDVMNLVDTDRIHEYAMSTHSYATSTIGTPSHAGTTIDENYGSELMFSVATDEEPPTDMSDDAIGSELSESRPQTANDNSIAHDEEMNLDGMQDISVTQEGMISEDDTREATTPDLQRSTQDGLDHTAGSEMDIDKMESFDESLELPNVDDRDPVEDEKNEESTEVCGRTDEGEEVSMVVEEEEEEAEEEDDCSLEVNTVVSHPPPELEEHTAATNSDSQSPDCVIVDEENFSDNAASPEIETNQPRAGGEEESGTGDCEIQETEQDTNEISLEERKEEPALRQSEEEETPEDEEQYAVSGEEETCRSESSAVVNSGNLRDLPEEGDPSGGNDKRSENEVSSSSLLLKAPASTGSSSTTDATLSDDDTDIDLPQHVDNKHSETASDSTIEDLNQSNPDDCSTVDTLWPVACQQQIKHEPSVTADYPMLDMKPDTSARPATFVTGGLVPPPLPPRCRAQASGYSNRRRRRALSCRDLLIAVEQRKKGQQKNGSPCCIQGGSHQEGCYCKLQPMLPCQKCGAYWHSDCIGPSRICSTCLLV